jgi:hypothetical protein
MINPIYNEKPKIGTLTDETSPKVTDPEANETDPG